MNELKKPDRQPNYMHWGIIGIGVPAMMCVWFIPVLFLRGCNLNDAEETLFAALHKAIEQNHPDIVRLLKAAGAKE